MNLKALIVTSVASMIDQFNINNIILLQSQSYEVHVACNFYYGNSTSQSRVDLLKDKLRNMNVKFFNVPFPRKITNLKSLIISYKSLNELLKNQNYDLLHCHSPIAGFLSRIAFNKFRKKFNGKLIYTAHGFHFHKKSSIISWLLYFPIEYFLAKFTDILICINSEDFKLSKTFFNTNIKYISGIGVSLSKIIRGPNSFINFPLEEDKGFYLINIGELNSNKNQQIILKALARINNPKIKLVIFGIGKNGHYLKKLILKLKLVDRVFLLGYKENVIDYLYRANAFILSSYREGLSVALMEAMACKIPIIASKIRGNTDLINHNHNGFLFNPNNFIQLSIYIQKLYSDIELRKKFSLNSFKKVKNFSSERVDLQMTRIYKSILKL